MSIEYDLENESVTLYDVVISIPLPYVPFPLLLLFPLLIPHSHPYSDGSYPTVSSHSGDWSLNPSSHSLDWKIATISPSDDTKSGSLIFNVNGVDAGAFFPVEVSFVGQGSLAGVGVAEVAKTAGGAVEEWSLDAVVSADEYLVV